MAARLCSTFTLWSEIQDLVGVATAWPAAIRAAFWTRDLNHWMRTRVVAFAWINGLHIDVLLQWATNVGMAQFGSPGYRHMEGLHQKIQDGKKYTLWAWNVTLGRYEMLDGTPKYY